MGKDGAGRMLIIENAKIANTYTLERVCYRYCTFTVYKGLATITRKNERVWALYSSAGSFCAMVNIYHHQKLCRNHDRSMHRDSDIGWDTQQNSQWRLTIKRFHTRMRMAIEQWERLIEAYENVPKLNLQWRLSMFSDTSHKDLKKLASYHTQNA